MRPLRLPRPGPTSLALHGTVFVGLAALTWRKWADPLIDFGRELYVPWRMLEGEILYRDLASIVGPFSDHLNALWFRLFGVSFLTLALCNLAILAGITWGVHRLTVKTTDRLTATVTTLVFLLVFAFAQHVEVSNFNYVTPYSHGATHGIAALVGMIVCAHRGIGEPRARWFALVGLLLGATLLMKPEIGLAGAGVAGAALLSLLWVHGAGRDTARATGALVVATATLPVAFGLHFLRHLPWPEAVRATAGAWSGLFGSRVAANDFHLAGMGLDAPVRNAGLALSLFGGLLSVLVLLVAADVAYRRIRIPPLAMSALRVAAIPAVAVLAALGIPWLQVPRVLPLTTAVLLAVAGATLWRRRRDPEAAVGPATLLMASAAALGLLAKILLNTRIHQYGFYLAMPATLLLVVALVKLIPAALERRLGGGAAFRTLAIMVVAGGVTTFVARSWALYDATTLTLGEGADALQVAEGRVSWRGPAAITALEWIRRNVPSDGTLAVLPEGVMLNYLARRPNPTPYFMVPYPEYLVFGEDAVLEAYRASPPDFLIEVQRNLTEFGLDGFGDDPRYGPRLAEWIRERYEGVDSVVIQRDDGIRRGLVMHRLREAER